MPDQPDETPNKLRTGWDEFASWHGDPKLYREIYTRAIGALIAALVIYLVAALFGVVSAAPGLFIGGLLTLYSLVVWGKVLYVVAKRGTGYARHYRQNVGNFAEGLAVAAVVVTVISVLAGLINR